jgi:hypothetical protein
MRRAIQGAALALGLLGCTGLFDPYPDAKYDCEKSDCTHCVPIEGTPQPKGNLCSVTRDPSPPPPDVHAPAP